MKKIILVSIVLLLAGFSTTATAQKKSSFKIATAGVGIDGLRIGKSTRADVIKKYGRGFRTIKNGSYSTQMKYRNGLSFYYCQKDRKQEIFVMEMRSPARGKTARGIILGKSNTNQLIRKYGQPVKLNSLRFKGIEFYYNRYKGKKIVSVIDVVEKNGMRQCRE